MLSAWIWVKHHAVLLLSGLSSILAAWIAWGMYQRRVGSLKDALVSERALGTVRVLEARRDELVAQDAQLEKTDDMLSQRIASAKREAVQVMEAVEGKTDEEVAARFGDLYQRSIR